MSHRLGKEIGKINSKSKNGRRNEGSEKSRKL